MACVQTLKRTLILLAVACAAAGVDGSIRGLRMPPDVPIRASLPPSALAPAATASTAPAATSGPELVASSDDLGMTAAELRKAVDAKNVVVLDSRPVEQYAEGHIPGAYSLPFDAFDHGRPALLDTGVLEGTPLVVYCDGGDCHASHNVASMLAEMGYKDVFIFQRGFPAWKDAGYPVETGGPEL